MLIALAESAIPEAVAIPLPPPDEHQILVMLCQVFALLIAARVAGHVARRIGQPRVVGELCAGVLFGPSILGAVAPDAHDWLFPADAAQSGLLLGLAWLGALFLVALAGAETDIDALKAHGKVAIGATIGSLIVPLGAGFALGYVLPADFLGNTDNRLAFAMFVAVALSISSMPVAAKILDDIGHLRSPFGQLTLGVAMANDVIGWLLLGLVGGVAAGRFSAGPLVLALGGLAVMVPVFIRFGPGMVDSALAASHRRSGGPAAAASLATLAIVGAAAMTQALGVEAVVGAFLAGVAIGRSRLRQLSALHHLEVITAGVLAPLFFATAGVRVDLAGLFSLGTAGWALVVLAVATGAKLIGAGVGARLTGFPASDSVALGAALNARGALEIVVATVGLSIGVLSATSYSVIVLMAIATCVVTAPLVKLAKGTGTTRGADGNSEGLFSRDTAVLLAVHPAAPDSREIAATLWTDQRRHRALVVPGSTSATGDLNHRFLSALRTEAGAGHGAIFITERSAPNEGLSSSTLAVAGSTRQPLVIWREVGDQPDQSQALDGILVPVDGRPGSSEALNVASVLAARWGSPLVIMHVVRSGRNDQGAWLRATAIVDRAADQVRDRNLPIETVVVAAKSASGPIIARSRVSALTVVAASRRADRVVGGSTFADVARAGGRPQLVVVEPQAADTMLAPWPADTVPSDGVTTV
jgi:Kef-type K+ transport system membrane component KefB